MNREVALGGRRPPGGRAAQPLGRAAPGGGLPGRGRARRGRERPRVPRRDRAAARRASACSSGRSSPRPRPLRRYAVNVLVDRTGLTGAPVVYEDLPSHAGLVGRIEHRAHFGALVTDFTLLRAGALHRANGGYLVLDVRRLLAQPFAWEDLKRALRSGQIRIEPPERLLGFAGAGTLEPEPIPLTVKVVLVGDRLLHLLLSELDPEFAGLFKVAADFEDQAPRADGGELRLARLVAGIARDERLRPFDRSAVARVVEQAARLADDGEKVTTRVRDIADLVREADHAAAASRPPRGGPGRRAGRARRGGAAPGPDPAAHPGSHRRGDAARRHGGRAGRPGERPLGPPGRPGRLRPAEPDHRAACGWGAARWWTSSARWSSGAPSTRRASSSWRASSGPATRRPAAVAAGQPGLRAVLRRRRGGQRLLGRALRPALRARRAAHPAGDRRDRLGEPARAGPGDRRREREDRGLLRRLPGARPRRRRRAWSCPPPTSGTSCSGRTWSRPPRQGRFHVWAVETVDEGIRAPHRRAGWPGAAGRHLAGGERERAGRREAPRARRGEPGLLGPAESRPDGPAGHLSPTIRPSGVTSTSSAAGCSGSPGMSPISPVSAVTKPAPAWSRTSRTGSR